MVAITENDRKIIDFTEDVVCKYFNVNLSDVTSKNHKRDASLARGFIWYILHCEYGLSITKISNEYYRNRRSTNHLIAKIKMAIKKQSYYREMYNNIKTNLIF